MCPCTKDHRMVVEVAGLRLGRGAVYPSESSFGLFRKLDGGSRRAYGGGSLGTPLAVEGRLGLFLVLGVALGLACALRDRVVALFASENAPIGCASATRRRSLLDSLGR